MTFEIKTPYDANINLPKSVYMDIFPIPSGTSISSYILWTFSPITLISLGIWSDLYDIPTPPEGFINVILAFVYFLSSIARVNNYFANFL